MIPKKNAIYKHFKGNLYKVITMAIHSETGEDMVVCQGLYGEYPVYCRPLSMFVSEVDHEKYPDVTQKLRFEPVGETQWDLSAPIFEAENTLPAPTETDNADVDKTMPKEKAEEEEESVDPMILEFLDAETVTQKRNILTALHHRITNEMIDTLAVVMDVVVEEGEIENRYQQLKTCLETIDRYEIERNN